MFLFAHSFVSHLPQNETKNKVIFRTARVSSSSAALGESFVISKQTTADLGSRTAEAEEGGGRKEEVAGHLLLLLLLVVWPISVHQGQFRLLGVFALDFKQINGFLCLLESGCT